MAEAMMVTVEAASVISFSDDMTQERDARLLEVGRYPDKGLVVTEEDLDGIVARFSPDGAPVKVEHVDTPLDPLGHVRRVWREGGALMARLAFPPDLAGFLRRRGVQKLSVGLSRAAEGLGLAEVSLVLKPRIASAAMFGEAPPAPNFGGAGVGVGGGAGVYEFGDGEQAAEIVRLRAELVSRDVAAQIASLKAAGRVVPATEALVRALLGTPPESRITLSAGTGAEPVAGVFLQFLKAMPPLVRFGDMAAGASAAASDPAVPGIPQLSEEEQAWLRDTLGLDPAQVLEMMLTGKLTTSGTSGSSGTSGTAGGTT